METFYAECLERFTALHNEIKKSLDGLDTEALDWTPVGDTNSINVLVVHLTAAEEFWAAVIPLGSTSDRNRPDEFEAKGLTAGQLTARLDDALAKIESAFGQLTVADLDKMCHSAQHNLDVTAAWAILHALEHTAQHVGHIQLTAQLVRGYK